MASPLKSESSFEPLIEPAQPASWLKVEAVAAGSALVGGLVAAWWYRKTLSKLREAEEEAQNPHFGIPVDEPADEA
jgi:hypothetical protein